MNNKNLLDYRRFFMFNPDKIGQMGQSVSLTDHNYGGPITSALFNLKLQFSQGGFGLLADSPTKLEPSLHILNPPLLLTEGLNAKML